MIPKVQIMLGFLLALIACKKDPDTPVIQNTVIESVYFNDQSIQNNKQVYNIPTDSVIIKVNFANRVNTKKVVPGQCYINNGIGSDYNVLSASDSNQFIIKINPELSHYTKYTLTFLEGENLGVKLIDSYTYTFQTTIDSTQKFPSLTNDELLTLVQQQTFKFFWDYAHPTSGLIRERLGSGDIVTSGGSGFGLMAILVGIERGFITRQQGFKRLQNIVRFLDKETTQKFHGAFSHWLNGETGEVIPFSTKDNGADLVETAFLMQGLLTVRQYFKNGTQAEQQLSDTINKLWEQVEWSWFRKDNQDVLFWHWSPDYHWDMNMQIRGWNECLIVYVLAASSPTFTIPDTVYHNGWARNGDFPMKNGKKFYNITLPLSWDYGGPLFWAHYSFLGLDPRNLSDKYANYWDQNQAHSLINYKYCKVNPKKYAGYSANCWGLTACDIPGGYGANEPNNDRGVIAPTAALSSMPYTPVESMEALNFFYYILGDKLWGEYGFHDSFSMSENWWASSYISIDQGPIICMVENHRSGLLWDLFMSAPEVQNGLTKLGFTY